MEANKFIELFLNKIVENNLATIEELQGCSDNEINEVMIAQGVESLPKFYIEFLKTAGNSAGRLWFDSHYLIEDLLDIEDTYIDFYDGITDKDELELLPEDAFVFNTTEYVVYNYFCTQEQNPDPLVFSFVDPTDSHTKLDKRLSEFLLNVY